jgi:arsenate reductase
MKNASHKKRVLFVCSGNSCRSQIAEGWARALGGDRIEVSSAGVEAHGVDPVAVAIMAEAGIDISSQRSKSLNVLPDLRFDYVVTLSDRATDYIRCLSVPATVMARPCESPAPRAVGGGTSLARYRRIRDDIRNDVFGLLKKVLRKSRQPANPQLLRRKHYATL